jgi:hypothetical protein
MSAGGRGKLGRMSEGERERELERNIFTNEENKEREPNICIHIKI